MLSLKNLKISLEASTSQLKRFIQGHPDANGTVSMSYLGLPSSLLFYSFQAWEDALFLDTWIHLELKSTWKPEHLSSWKWAEFSSKWASYSMRNIRSAKHTAKTVCLTVWLQPFHPGARSGSFMCPTNPQGSPERPLNKGGSIQREATSTTKPGH